MFAILQKYDFSSKSQPTCKEPILGKGCLRYCKSTIFQANHNKTTKAFIAYEVVCDTAKVRFFKQITTRIAADTTLVQLFAILQKYDFSSKSQLDRYGIKLINCCLRYCKSTIFQANHNFSIYYYFFFSLFAILQKYDFSSKSQLVNAPPRPTTRCLRYCKSTIFQANHNIVDPILLCLHVVCDTAKVRFFKQITTLHTLQTI